MTCYAIKVRAMSKGTFAIQGYGPKSGITDVVLNIQMCIKSGDHERKRWGYDKDAQSAEHTNHVTVHGCPLLIFSVSILLENVPLMPGG